MQDNLELITADAVAFAEKIALLEGENVNLSQHVDELGASVTAMRDRLTEEMTYSAQLHDMIDDIAEKIREAADLLKKLGLYEEYSHVFDRQSTDPLHLVAEWAHIAKTHGESFQAFDNLIELGELLSREDEIEEIDTDEPRA